MPRYVSTPPMAHHSRHYGPGDGASPVGPDPAVSLNTSWAALVFGGNPIGRDPAPVAHLYRETSARTSDAAYTLELRPKRRAAARAGHGSALARRCSVLTVPRSDHGQFGAGVDRVRDKPQRHRPGPRVGES